MPEEDSPRSRGRALGRLLVLAVGLQAVLGAVRAWKIVVGLPSLGPTLLGKASEEGAFASAWFSVAVLAVAGLAAVRGGRGTVRRLETAGLAGLLTLAAAGVALTLAGLATTRLVPAAAWAVVAGAFLLAAARPASRQDEDPSPLSACDAGTFLFLVLLLVPSVFAYLHFDAKAIWGCRALAIAASGSLESLAACSHSGYPPLFSLLLAVGGRDPVLEGRLAAWLLAVFVALFLRGSFARLSPRYAAAATLFVVSTGWVWVSSAMYYANVPLMAFLSGGLVLSLGPVPRSPGDRPGPVSRSLASALLFAAAALVRPDGLVYTAAVAAALALLALRKRVAPDLLPFAGAALGWTAWALRPASLRFATRFVEQASTWRSAGATEAEAIRRILHVSFHALQGLWLAHWGLGATIWVLLGAAIVVLSRDHAPSAATVAWGGMVIAGLGTVLALYSVLPFTVDVVAGVQPDPPRDFLGSWDNFARVGLGRMVVHLLPAGAFFVLGVVEDSASSAGS